MPVDLLVPWSTIFGFLLVLARVSGAMVFVPMPGLRSSPAPVKAAFSLALTLALASRWPNLGSEPFTPARLIGWALAEAAVGIAIGVAVAILMEAFTFGAQVLGLQAGYAYASTIDPGTDADSGVLLVVAQLAAGMAFFALGLDREVVRLFALSLERIPPGAYRFGPASAEMLIRLSSSIFTVGMRLALPVVTLLVLVDVAMALLGRVNQQLQLLSLAFPAKMLTALLVLSWTAALTPRLLMELAGHTWVVVYRLLGL